MAAPFFFCVVQGVKYHIDDGRAFPWRQRGDFMFLGRTLTLASVAILAGCAAPTADFSASDEAAIRDASSQWVETYNRNDWQALSQLFTGDAVMMPPNGEAVVGRDAIAAWEAEFETGFRIAFAIDEIEGDGDLAFVRGRSCVFIPLATGEYGVDIGKFLEVRERQADGSWLISADIFNSDQQMGAELLDNCPFAELP